MFTGLIQALGTLRRTGTDKLSVSCEPHLSTLILQDLEIGDSVAVDGVCLTVVDILSTGFTAAVSPETLSRSTLEQKLEGASVNLETSLRVGSKLGGHFVTGHVDGIGYLQASMQTAIAWEMSFTVPSAQVARYIVPKGSIAVNGISLTVADCNSAGTWFKVAVIPHTYAATNLHQLQPGSSVNLEGDILGKYVEKFLRSPGHALDFADSSNAALEDVPTSLISAEGITPGFLAEHGYL